MPPALGSKSSRAQEHATLLSRLRNALDTCQTCRIGVRNAGRNEDDGAGFLAMLAADPEVAAHLSRAELEALADPQYYLTYVDTAFARLGLL